MLDWNKVKKDKALLEKVEELVNDVAHTYHDFPDDIRDELNRLTGNDWSGDNYIEYCGGYEESFLESGSDCVCAIPRWRISRSG